MQVFTERVILQTDHAGHLTKLPMLPSNARVEAIFIVLDQNYLKLNLVLLINKYKTK